MVVEELAVPSRAMPESVIELTPSSVVGTVRSELPKREMLLNFSSPIAVS